MVVLWDSPGGLAAGLQDRKRMLYIGRKACAAMVESSVAAWFCDRLKELVASTQAESTGAEQGAERPQAQPGSSLPGLLAGAILLVVTAGALLFQRTYSHKFLLLCGIGFALGLAEGFLARLLQGQYYLQQALQGVLYLGRVVLLVVSDSRRGLLASLHHCQWVLGRHAAAVMLGSVAGAYMYGSFRALAAGLATEKTRVS